MKDNCVLLVNRPENPVINPIVSENIKKYADKINADFVYSQSPLGSSQLYHYLKDYKRVICLNGNIIIRDDCPNLFDIVPKKKIGLLNDSFFRNVALDFSEAKRNYPDMAKSVRKWEGKYYNTNVIVASRKDRNLFKSPHFVAETGLPPEHQLLNLRIILEKKKVFELESKFNRAHYMDKTKGNDRLSAYIINYEGAPINQLYPILVGDLRKWDNETDYSKFDKREVIIEVSAGMGDQICTEPVIRYIKDTEFKNDNITVLTHHPRLFRHIEGVKVLDYNEFNGVDTNPLQLKSCPSDQDSPHKLSHIYFHPTDFSSMSIIKKTIPNIHKTIKLEATLEGVSEIMDIVGDPEILENMILIHPGKWWESKTFPEEWWQEIIDGLDKEGFTVGLIGKTLSGKQGFVDVECPENGIDFRDLTTLDGMLTLIEKCPVLLTNDSSPIHIGGAFDNWIVTLATAKLDDHILPYRKGTQYYKTVNLCKGLLIDELNLSWLDEKPDTIADIPKGKKIEDYLPEPSDVIKVLKAINDKKVDDYWRLTQDTFDIYSIIEE
jgi:hypothetical protein